MSFTDSFRHLVTSTCRHAIGRHSQTMSNIKVISRTLTTYSDHHDQMPDQLVGLDRPRILITGGLGQLGQGMARLLRSKYGRDNVILSDIVKPPRRQLLTLSPYLFIDVLDPNQLSSTVVNYQIDWIIHFSAILSAIGERNVPLALRINVEGVQNILETANKHALRVFVPSTIGAFGPTSPRVMTPDITPQRPRTIYGVAKVYAELLGEYYAERFGTDFRSLRFPGVISASKPGGGTTDYAIKIFYDAISSGRHICNIGPDTRLPMIYIDDCLRSVVDVMEAPEHMVSQRTYNVTAMSFTPDEIAHEIKKVRPSFEIMYDIDPVVQKIADSWPQSLNDSTARAHWGWHHDYDLPKTVDVMFRLLTQKAKQRSDKHSAEQQMKAYS